MRTRSMHQHIRWARYSSSNQLLACHAIVQVYQAGKWLLSSRHYCNCSSTNEYSICYKQLTIYKSIYRCIEIKLLIVDLTLNYIKQINTLDNVLELNTYYCHHGVKLSNVNTEKECGYTGFPSMTHTAILSALEINRTRVTRYSRSWRGVS